MSVMNDTTSETFQRKIMENHKGQYWNLWKSYEKPDSNA